MDRPQSIEFSQTHLLVRWMIIIHLTKKNNLFRAKFLFLVRWINILDEGYLSLQSDRFNVLTPSGFKAIEMVYPPFGFEKEAIQLSPGRIYQSAYNHGSHVQSRKVMDEVLILERKTDYLVAS